MESGNFFTRRPSFDKTIAYLTFFSYIYVLVLKIRAYHLLLTTFSILQIARNQKYLMKDVCILVWFDIPCAYTVDSCAWKPACNAPLRPSTFAYFYACIDKRMSRERFWQKWQQNGSLQGAHRTHLKSHGCNVSIIYAFNRFENYLKSVFLNLRVIIDDWRFPAEFVLYSKLMLGDH